MVPKHAGIKVASIFLLNNLSNIMRKLHIPEMSYDFHQKKQKMVLYDLKGGLTI